jgi:hypothetical protein
MMEEIAVWNTYNKAHLCRLDETRRMENCFVRICNPIQQYSYTVGKNSSDSAMIIDAMDLLYSDKVGFVSFLVILILQD